MAGAEVAPGQKSTELSCPRPLPLGPMSGPVWEDSDLLSRRSARQGQDSDTSAQAPSKAGATSLPSQWQLTANYLDLESS